MHQLIVNDPDWIVYYPDTNLENFVFNAEEKRIKIVDLEYLVIVHRSVYQSIDLSFNQSNQLCRMYRIDYNVEQGSFIGFS